MFQNNIWRFFKLLWTALMPATDNGYTEIVKILLKKDGIDINSKNVYLFSSKFQLIIRYFKIIIEI